MTPRIENEARIDVLAVVDRLIAVAALTDDGWGDDGDGHIYKYQTPQLAEAVDAVRDARAALASLIFAANRLANETTSINVTSSLDPIQAMNLDRLRKALVRVGRESFTRPEGERNA